MKRSRQQVDRYAADDRPGMRYAGSFARPGARHGLTLLELMLALALSAVVLVLINMAVDLHLRVLDSQREKVERAQLGRAVLKRIADDLRSAVQPASGDFSSVESLASSALGGGAAGELEGLDGLGDLGDLSDLGADLGIDGEVLSSSCEDIADSTSLPASPGLYGNQYELQVDVSRLPRVDEFQRLVAPDALFAIQDIPSDVKTVAYYVRGNNGLGSSAGFDRAGIPTTAGVESTGLVRRVLDRAVTQYAADGLQSGSLDEMGKMIAPEVTALEFQYFDGTEWTDQWDSEELGGLPVAIRITLAIASDERGSQAEPVSGTEQLRPDEVVSLVVRLPTARPIEQSEEDTGSAGLESVGL